tara:strand:+ start:7404 stop:7538 length:135 start_codon:yes stop_codon:yes gene_type:complete
MLMLFFGGVLAKYKNKYNTKTFGNPQSLKKITGKSHAVVRWFVV